MAYQIETFEDKAIDNFKSITKYPLDEYFLRVGVFFDSYDDNIKDFYAGKTQKPDAAVFDFLNSMIKETNKITSLYKTYKTRFTYLYDWDMMEKVESIEVSLLTTSNSSKFFRSAITNSNYSKNPEYSYSLKQLQTLENVSNNIQGDENPDDDWQQIAIRNDLQEDQYTPQGGVQIMLPSRQINTSAITSVVDNIIGERIYGIDIAQNITFDTTQNDLLVLSYQDTAKQSIYILTTIQTGSVPEFPKMAYPAEAIVGSNAIAYTFPTFLRQLTDLFSTDDSLTSFRVINIDRVDDSYSINLEVDTILGATMKQNLSL